jgi:Protein of unknown function (DUF3237)
MPEELSPPPPGLALLARFHVELGRSLWDLGRTTPSGTRRIVPITGGRFEGPQLSGEILDNGADWQVVTDEGTTVVDTRYLLRLSDGALAYLRTRGFRHGPPDVLARIADGELVDPSLYYFRVSMAFETASTTYGWLNRTLAIGSALRLTDAVVYDAYQVT